VTQHVHQPLQPTSAPHTHPFSGPLSGTTRVSRYQKGKTNLDFTKARDREWQWHQLGHMQVCTSLQIDNHASTPPLVFFTGWMPFLLPNQQCQSTEGTTYTGTTAGVTDCSVTRHVGFMRICDCRIFCLLLHFSQISAKVCISHIFLHKLAF